MACTLKGMKQVNSLVTLTGSAQSNERVAELLRNLSNNSPFVTKPELVEIIAGYSFSWRKRSKTCVEFYCECAIKKTC
jgi:type IV pilus assembly protein PilN